MNGDKEDETVSQPDYGMGSNTKIENHDIIALKKIIILKFMIIKKN